MNKRKLERVAVMLLSIVMLISSTGILSSLAANVSESSLAPSSTVSETSTSTEASQKSEKSTSTAKSEETTSAVADVDGNGTTENPYKISDAEDFLKMTGIICSTANANKNFVLTNDIDLSSIKEETLKSREGAIVSVNKAMSKESANVFFNLDGKGHTIKGLNIVAKSLESVSIFGFVNSKSTISNLKIENPVINSKSENLQLASVLVATNEGTIKNVEIIKPVVTATKAMYTGIVAAVNDGTISNVTVKAGQTNESAATEDAHTIFATGTVGAIAGVNNGTISNVSAINIGMFVSSAESANTVYGGIAGRSSGKIMNSVSTGNVCGGKLTDVAGGVVGKAIGDLKLANNYTLVSVAKTLSGCAVIGADGKDEMLDDCYWSAKISGRNVPATDVADNENNLDRDSYRIVNVGESISIKASDVKSKTWGKAVFALSGSFTSKSESVSFSADSTALTYKGIKADNIGFVSYTALVTLPASVGAGSESVTLKQNMRIAVLTVADKADGDGTKANPLVISDSAEFSFLNYASGIYCKLDKNISVASPVQYFDGVLDGCGYTITSNGQVFTNVNGTVKNVNVTISKDTSAAVFGMVIAAQMNNVSVSQKENTKLIANSGNVGIFAGKVIGKSTFDNCRVKGNIYLPDDKYINIGGFAGNIAGKDTVITNSGAVVNLSQKDSKIIASVANFIGTVTAENVTLENCYAGGKNEAGKYSFIGSITAKSISVKNAYLDSANKPLSFEDYKLLVSESQFGEWSFNDGSYGFFTGNKGTFESTLPSVKAVQNSASADFKAVCDTTKVNANVTVADGKLVLSVVRADGVVTVKSVPVTVVNTKTGLTSTIYVSNGLEKDGNGNWVVSTAYDLAYIGENIAELSNDSFVVTKDIDMSVIKSFTAIGTSATPFSGTFNGGNHTISGLTINGTANTALFGTVSDAVVKNISFANASVKSEGGYAAVLAGHVKGKTVISNITVDGAEVEVNENYSAILVASVNYATNVQITDISIRNSAIKSSAGYVGAVVGRITDNTTVSDVTVENVKLSGSDNVSGVTGLVQGETSVVISNAKVNNSDISGVSYVSGIANGTGKGNTIKDSGVYNSKIYTLGKEASFVAGGIAASFDSLIENVTIESTAVTAGIAGGIAGRTGENCALVIKNAQVNKSKISAEGANTVAAGILAIHKAKGTANIVNCVVSEGTVISEAAVTSAIVGDFAGAESNLKIDGAKTLAEVNGCETADAISAAGVVGRIGSSAVNNISVNNVKVGGKVSGAEVLGGAIGLVKEGTKYNAESAIISDSVIYTQIEAFDEKTQTGMIIGGTGSKKIFDSADMDKAISDVVISTYYASVSAYSVESGLAGGKFVDMDKPNGNSITSSVPMLSTTDETSVTISNLPNVKGYSFDSSTGWVSESDERVKVVSCTENTAVLKAEHMADISVVSYYVLDSDKDVRVPVHFRIVADIRTPLKGEGTKDNPYLVTCAYDLETVTRYSDKNAYFALTDDIVFKPEDFEFGGAFYNVSNGVVTIGNAENGFKGSFTGLYNGKVHSITGLTVSGNAFGGLFGATDGAVISDIVINNADISALNYVAIVAGSAKNTTIKNITINTSSVKAVEFGSYAGSVVGYAENTKIDNVKINNTNVKSNTESTEATVEIAGGVAGVFDGTIKNVEINNVTVDSGTFAGGFIGVARNEKTAIVDSSVNATLNAEIAGGAAAKIDSPLNFSVSGCTIGGAVNGTEISAGLIGLISSEDSSDKASKLEAPMISNTVITADIAEPETSAVAVGEASTAVMPDVDNDKTDVFTNVYYSSYQNSIGIFGNEEINAYQTSEYAVNDLSAIKYVDGGVEKASLPLGTGYLTLGEDSIKLNAVDGTYKSFTAGGKIFELVTITSNIDNAISYDPSAFSLKLNNAENDDLKLVFVYNDGLELAMDVDYAEGLNGNGTADAPYEIYDAEDFKVMLHSAANENVYYVLMADISLSDVSSAEVFAGVLDGQGYVLYDFNGSNLFGRVTGTIKNTGFAGFSVQDNSSNAVGAVAAVVDGGQITDSFVIADVNSSVANADVGILAGRLQNGAVIKNVVTSGKAVAVKAITVGGAVGSVSASTVENVTSTAYVKGSKNVGGIVGEAENAEIGNVIFANMVELSDGNCGNVIGSSMLSKVANAYFDSQTSRVETGFGSGDEIPVNALTTSKLVKLSLAGFAGTNGYPVPASLSAFANAKFATGVAFAAMKVNYLAGLNAGTAYNYTSISVDSEVNGNEVKTDTTTGLTLTLVPSADYAGSQNAIVRYSNPLSTNSVNISYSIVDATNGRLGNKLIGLMFKSKIGEKSSAFDLFTRANAQAKSIGSVLLTDGGFYVDADLPQGMKYSVTAIDENGNALQINDAKNEGSFVSTESSKTVAVTITVENETEDIWGLRSLWSVIGK